MKWTLPDYMPATGMQEAKVTETKKAYGSEAIVMTEMKKQV
jgi:hypothetical protein